ncbi:hypothetical protein BAPAT_2324 [Bacillus anthracis str. SVA11]|nr:hypothetical protein BAPAT_2324 [Bacillus anthracis str. SVA11]EDR95047.1 hypothetical protein BAH_2484 [Bacillus anthracis str. A0442]
MVIKRLPPKALFNFQMTFSSNYESGFYYVVQALLRSIK